MATGYGGHTVGAHSAWEPHRAKAFERLSTKDELRRPTDPIRLPGQMHVYVASSDPEIREVVRIGYGELVAYTEHVSGLSPSGS